MATQIKLADARTAKNKLENLAKQILNSNDIENTYGIAFGELLPLFSTKRLTEIRKKIVKRLELEFILASNRQRRKKSQIHDKPEKYEGTTWNEDYISSALISWFTKTSIPTIKINLNTYQSDGVLTIWDGESKFQILWYFIINKAPDMFRVLNDDGTFTHQVSNFINHKERFRTSSNSHVISELEEMFIEARKTHTTYIGLEWMESNGFQTLINCLLELPGNCVFQNLSEMAEGEAYHREGSVGAKQSDVQLTNSQQTEAWYDITRYDDTHKPTNRFKSALTYSIFNDETSTFFRDIYDDVHSGENYQGYEEYIYDFILTLLFRIKNGKRFEFGMPDSLQPYELSGIARPYDKGTRLVQDRMIEYKEFLTNPDVSPAEKEKFLTKLVEVFRLIEMVFGYPGPNQFDKYPAGIGLRNSRIAGMVKPTSAKEKSQGYYSIKEKQTSELRDLLAEYGIVRDRGLGKIDKFILGNHLMIYVICKSITYIIENKDVKNNQLTDIIYEIMSIVSKDWATYVFEYRITNNDDVLDYDSTDNNEVRRGVDEKLLKSGIPFGLYYTIAGGNLEKVAYVFIKFIKEIVEPKLDSIYISATSTSKEMRRFQTYLRTKVRIEPEKFFIYDTVNDEPLKLDSFDIGHPDAESQGNILFHKQFLLEERGHNRHQFQTDSKDVLSYYRCLMANHNDVFNNTKNAFASALQNPSEFEYTLNKMNESKQALQNLKYLLEYLDIQFDENASYVNGTVQKEEYIK